MNSVLVAARHRLEVPDPSAVPTLRPVRGMWAPGFETGSSVVYFDEAGAEGWWADLRRETEAGEKQDLAQGLALLSASGDLHAVEVLHRGGMDALRVALAAWVSEEPVVVWPDGPPPLLLRDYLAELDRHNT